MLWFQVIEYALSLLPYHSVTVQTPQCVTYEGKTSSVKKICGVSILRAGETMEAALTEVCKDIRLGHFCFCTHFELLTYFTNGIIFLLELGRF